MSGGTFAVGDVVYLKGGSSRMTIEKLDDDGRVHVVWMNYDDKAIQRTNLPAATLDKFSSKSTQREE